MIIESTFNAPWWLRNAHLQTLFASRVRKFAMPEIRAERVTTPDDDFLDLHWFGKTDGPLVVLFHGLEGSSSSSYACGLMQQLIEAGLGGVVMHFRGCSGEPNRQCQSYHCGHTTDITWLLHQLAQNHPEQALFTVGFSIGGAALLNTLAQEELPEALQLSIAISPPLEPRAGAIRMNQGFSRVYQHVLVGDCVASAKAKLAAGVPLPVDPEKLDKAKTFWDFDNDVTAPIHGFSSADDYYNRAASRPRLKDIERACHIIHAVDDPFFQPSMVPSEEELSEHVTLEISQTGGHVAFVQGSPFAPFYWLEKRIRQLIVDKLSY